MDFFNAGDAQNVSCVRNMRVSCDCLETIKPGVDLICMEAQCGKW